MLQKMTEAEFRKFKEYSVSDYAKDLMKAEGIAWEQAYADAEKEFCSMLPDGADTEDQFLMTVKDPVNGKNTGWIWFSFEVNDGIKQVFLSDFLIFEDERRKGYASATMKEMENMAKAAGCLESVLYVWEHNVPGYSLYQKCGYKVMNRGENGSYMKKSL